MTGYHLFVLCFFCLSETIIFVIADGYREEDYDLKLRSDQRWKYDNKNQRKIHTEFDHAIDDDRCSDTIRGTTAVPVVKETDFGNVHGVRVTLCDGPGVPLRERPGQPTGYFSKNSVNVFLGIPYADAPTRQNNLQFKPPRRPERVVKIDATSYKPACPQNGKYMEKGMGVNSTDEDCLYLNVFTPFEKPIHGPVVTKKYPVLFYIHGGNFDHGSASLFPAHMLAASQEVIVVTFNYRLGYLGFLATSDEASPGNYGMFDQVEALKWVNRNIGFFDGDPKNVTAFGTGAGGASAALLALSPLSRRMIKRVIAQNGSPVADWAAIMDPLFMLNTSRILGEELGCSPSLDSQRLVECVGRRSNNEIKILKLKPRKGWLPWGPVVGSFSYNSVFLPQSPMEMLSKGFTFDDGFAYMTGMNRDEGASIFLENSRVMEDLRVTPENFDQRIRSFMKMYNYTVNADGIFDALSFMYKPPLDSENETLLRQGYINLLTDRYYTAPLDKTLQLMINNRVKTYAYVLNYTLQGYTLPLQDAVSTDVEYLLLSGAPFTNPKMYPSILNLKNARWTEEDRNMSQFMMEAWANFAKFGNPTPTRLFNTILWEPLLEDNIAYLNLNATNTTSTTITDYREKECRFWNSFLPFFIDREPPTWAPTLEPGLAEMRVVTSALWGSVAIATLLLLITMVCCILYCRIRRKPNEDMNSSREVIVNRSVAQQVTTV